MVLVIIAPRQIALGSSWEVVTPNAASIVN